VPRSVLKVVLLGVDGAGKKSLVRSLSGLRPIGVEGEMQGQGLRNRGAQSAEEVGDWKANIDKGGGGSIGRKEKEGQSAQRGQVPLGQVEEGCTVVIGGFSLDQIHGVNSSSNSCGLGYLNKSYYVCIAAVPLELSKTWIAKNVESWDIALLVYPGTDLTSETCDTLLQLGKSLPPYLPRLCVESKADLLTSSPEEVNVAAQENKQRLLSLLPQGKIGARSVTATSAYTGEGMAELVRNIQEVAMYPDSAVPLPPSGGIAAGEAVGWVNWRRFLMHPLTLASAAAGVASLSLCAVKYNQEMTDVFNKVLKSARAFISKTIKSSPVVSTALSGVSSWFTHLGTEGLGSSPSS
jgi:hypothetical protein